jgi:non-heme chloroperoxidase
MPSVRTDDGVSISYQIAGAGPLDLLLMHGWAGSSRYWHEVLRYLDVTGLRLLLADLRGHGASDRPTAGYSLERFARDMFAVADHAGAKRFVLVGFSMSGRFAQFIAAQEPERVLGQILIGPAPASELILPPEVHRAWVGSEGDRDRLRELLQPFLKEPLEPEVMERFLEDAIQVPAVALDETLNMCQTSFAERLATMRTRTLVIGGTHDPMLSPDFLRQHVVSPIAGARLALLECGHEIPVEKPRETAGLIEAFLAGLG